MRPLLLLSCLALAACASPCEHVDADQTDPAMRTCAFSVTLKEGSDGTFSPEDGAPVAFSAPDDPAIEGAFPDGSRLHGERWAAEGEPAPAHGDSARWVSTSALAPDRYALAMRWDGTVRVRNASGDSLTTVRVAEGEDVKAAKMGIGNWPNRATHLAFSPDGATLYGTDAQGHVTAWDATEGTTRWTATAALDHGGEDGRSITPDGLRALAVSPDGARVVAASARGVHVWDTASGEPLAAWVFPGTATSVTAVGFAPEGRHVVVQKSGRYTPPGVRYSNFDHSGQRTVTSTMHRTAGRKASPTVFLLGLP